MEYNYQYLKNPDGSIQQNQILRLPDYAYIPMVEDNSDYQAYLKWVSEGNTPLSADEVTK